MDFGEEIVNTYDDHVDFFLKKVLKKSGNVFFDSFFLLVSLMDCAIISFMLKKTHALRPLWKSKKANGHLDPCFFVFRAPVIGFMNPAMKAPASLDIQAKDIAVFALRGGPQITVKKVILTLQQYYYDQYL